MNRFFTKSIALVALVGAFTLVPAAKSEAAFDAWICNDYSCLGGDDLSVTDNGAGDLNPLVGIISIQDNTGIGGMLTSFDIAASHPAIAQPQLDMLFGTVSLGAGSVYIWTANDYTYTGSLTARIGGTLAAGATLQPVVVIDEASTPFVNWPGPFINTSPYAATWSAGSVDEPYRAWLGVNIVHTAAGVSSGDFHLVPEPMTLSLLGLGLAGLAARRRRS